MRNSRLDRILYIQQILVQGGVLNKQQTADHFGVSEKTIQRDLDTLRSYFADSEPRREILYNSAKGGYLLDDTLSRFLTSSEILAVCKILLESRSMVKEEMFPILDKLVQVCTPLDRLNQVKDLISNERFHYVEPQHGRKFIESLWDIGTAVENHNVMEITYCRTHDGETRVRTIEPVGILFSEYYFYLAAFIEGIDKDKHFRNPQDNSPTIYRIDRIQNYVTACQNGDSKVKAIKMLDSQAHPVHVRRRVADHPVRVYRAKFGIRARPTAHCKGAASDRKGLDRGSRGVWHGHPDVGAEAGRLCEDYKYIGRLSL